MLKAAGKEDSFDIMKEPDIRPQGRQIKSYEFVGDVSKHASSTVRGSVVVVTAHLPETLCRSYISLV